MNVLTFLGILALVWICGSMLANIDKVVGIVAFVLMIATIPVALVGLIKISNDNSKAREAAYNVYMQVYQVEMDKWRQSYYCMRDDATFLP